MQKRKLGKTGLEVSLIGFGGYHLIEIPKSEAEKLLNYYIDNGGNYIETAASYGDGESERKIGQVIKGRRDEVVLATKTMCRDYDGAKLDIDRSMENLNTNYIDIVFMHAVGTMEDLDKLLASNGAYSLVEDYIRAGKVGHIAISMHGQPDILIEAINRDKFEVVMCTFNYYDKFNFPKLEDKLIPLANEKNIGLMCMKPLADGFLWNSVDDAFRYAFSLPVSIVVTGMNTMEMLQKDLELAKEFNPMTEEEKVELFAKSPELADYVCRQCAKCKVCPEGIDIPGIFKLEGWFDRQMTDGKPRNPAEFALRDRLRFWFQNQKLALDTYNSLEINSKNCTECGKCMSKCPYNIDIIQKLKITHYKLGDNKELY